jgi:hypothetical protein
VRVGVPDGALTANAGMAAVSELCGRLGVIGALDAAVGPVKQRRRGFGATAAAMARRITAAQWLKVEAGPAKDRYEVGGIWRGRPPAAV